MRKGRSRIVPKMQALRKPGGVCSLLRKKGAEYKETGTGARRFSRASF